MFAILRLAIGFGLMIVAVKNGHGLETLVVFLIGFCIFSGPLVPIINAFNKTIEKKNRNLSDQTKQPS